MRLLAVTYGTEGDARPIAALCRALMDAGHEAGMLTASATLDSAKALGVPAVALAGDIRGTERPSEAISNVVAHGDRVAATANALARIANINAESWLRSIVAEGKGCDVILVSALASFAGLSAAEHLGIPAIGAGMIPITPTKTFASPFLPPRWVPGAWNHASHRFVNGMLWRAFRKATNQARTRVCGLPPRKEVWTSHPMLYGVSPSLLPQPNDWPTNARMCGQWLSPSRQWVAPRPLEDFLKAGDPPIYVGFGSMMGIDRQRLLQSIVDAVAGQRVLFYPGWSGMDAAGLPSNFFALGDTPHDWLFPRTKLVIHHGGSGTSHSAARAGVPSIVLPFAADQFFWANQLCKLGVADTMTAKTLSAAALTRSIELVTREEVRSRARALGEKMRAEDGLATATSAIATIMGQGAQ